MQQLLTSLIVRRWVLGLGLGLTAVVVGVVVVSRPQADHSTIEGAGSVAVDQKGAVGNAPEAVRACFAERAGDELASELRTVNRTLAESEQATLNDCFRDVTVPTDRHEVAATATASNPTNRSSTAQSTTTPPSSSSQSAATTTSKSSSTPSQPAVSAIPPPDDPLKDVHPEVWTKNGYDGASYEFKVNCGPNHPTLEECFLWDLTRVNVTAPGGTSYELAKDFNRNGYSGEVTRRWVLYGPAGGGLPVAGQYVFRYWQGDTVKEQEAVDYTPELVDPPSAVSFERTGDNDLIIRWQAPAGVSSRMWYKPSVDPPGNERQIISQTVAWDQTSATLNDILVSAGETVKINVAIFFPGGYAYPQPITVTW